MTASANPAQHAVPKNTIFTKLAWLVDAAAQALFFVAGAALVFMVLVVTVDVFTRAIFGMSGGAIRLIVSGGIELVRFALLFCIVCTLPAVVERGQVVVESFTSRLPARAKQLMSALYLLGFTVFGVILAWGWYDSAIVALQNREITQDLGIPMAPMLFAATACAVILAIRSLLCAVRALAGEVEL